MISIIIGFVILVVLGAIAPSVSNAETYGSRLEQYIVSNNPRDIADVERLTNEYDRKTKEGYL
jgi:hypothetical protein